MLKIGILALQGGFKEHQMRLQQCQGVMPEAVRLPEQLEAIEALILPGGESTSMLRLMDDNALLGCLRQRLSQGMPVWGTCAGAIVLAKMVNGEINTTLPCIDMQVERNGFGRQKDSFVADVIMADQSDFGATPFQGVFIRAPRILSVQSRHVMVRVLATLEHGEIVAVQQGACLATSFHPELTSDLRLHRYFVTLVRSQAKADHTSASVEKASIC